MQEATVILVLGLVAAWFALLLTMERMGLPPTIADMPPQPFKLKDVAIGETVGTLEFVQRSGCYAQMPACYIDGWEGIDENGNRQTYAKGADGEWTRTK